MPSTSTNSSLKIYSFGMVMFGRSYSAASSYRFGFNKGTLKDNEIYGEGNAYSTFYRELDVRLGIWWGCDPVLKAYESPYLSMGDNPIQHTDIFGNTLDVGKNDQSKEDIKSLADVSNRKFINIDDKTGRVSLNFGDLKKDEINKILAKDAGLKLISEVVGAEEKYLYEASDVILARNAQGNKDYIYTSQTSKGVANLSHWGADADNGHSAYPRDDYSGQVVISTSATWKEHSDPIDPRSPLQEKPRESIVFHELAENYERTHNFIDYRPNQSNQFKGAHDRAIDREMGWSQKSNEPGHGRVHNSPMPAGKSLEEYKKLINEYLENPTR